MFALKALRVSPYDSYLVSLSVPWTLFNIYAKILEQETQKDGLSQQPDITQ